ncbi:hypothetical protein LOK49_LG10G01307 [Camellia lanceoleosa]|uniref:Uncharacterized protein n=1 Tax=Camellia lanceoleosa TaxID=1840588 RepID=A0ACC0GEH5_9ERIC|nr:hypothetical protein LOK49_LG10G01307 [Camellia lanceoleosa]
MKLPLNTDIPRFESLLFQWANSLCQGATLPLPMPLKVDKIPGGARLGFITIGDGENEVLVYIDCLVFPATDGSGPVHLDQINEEMGPKVDLSIARRDNSNDKLCNPDNFAILREFLPRGEHFHIS